MTWSGRRKGAVSLLSSCTEIYGETKIPDLIYFHLFAHVSQIITMGTFITYLDSIKNIELSFLGKISS